MKILTNANGSRITAVHTQLQQQQTPHDFHRGRHHLASQLASRKPLCEKTTTPSQGEIVIEKSPRGYGCFNRSFQPMNFSSSGDGDRFGKSKSLYL